MTPSNEQIPSQPDTTPLTTDVVNNIPMHMAAAPVPPTAKPADELDQIMQAVGNELKKDDNRPQKRHLFGGHKKASPPTAMAHSVQAPPQPVATHQQQPAPQVPTKPNSKPRSSAPIFLIVVTTAVTSILIAAAFAAYR